MDNQQTGSGLYGNLFAACRERVTALDALESSLQQDFRCWRRTLLQEVTDVIRAVHAMRPVCPEEISDGQALALREMQVLEQYWTLLADERPAAAAEVWQERARLKRLLRQIGKTWNCFS